MTKDNLLKQFIKISHIWNNTKAFCQFNIIKYEYPMRAI